MTESQSIYTEIQRADSILLHCHPSPDPDSVGSVLAMKFALEGLGKKVTAIQGDSDIPPAFQHFPGAATIEKKNFNEVELNKFDLFIILDSGSPEMVSAKPIPLFPLTIKSVIIDHHATNKKYADVNYVQMAPSTTYVLYQLFKEWNIPVTHDIAANLFVGLYTDTGGFRYAPTDSRTFKVASELTAIATDFKDLLFVMENSQTKESIYFLGLALSSIKTFYNDSLAISTVSYNDILSRNIPDGEYVRGIGISNILKSVIGWEIGASLIEREKNVVKVSMRTRDSNKYDVSKLATALGGGGHKAAAGATLNMPIDEAVKKVVETAKMLYNL